MKITYNEIANPSKRGERFTRFSVKLDGKQVGTIKQTNQGWQYFPKGSHTAPGGLYFISLAACKASLEETEPRYLGPEANEVLALAREEEDRKAMADGRMADGVPEDEGQDTIGEYSNAELRDAAGLEPTYENTYWSGKGKHEAKKESLQKLIPMEGEVPNPNLHPALETFRVASNCYYDLYNNGLGNMGKEFHETFGFDAFEVGEPRYGQRMTDREDEYDGSVRLTQELIDLTESKMDRFILAAYAEQFPLKQVSRQSGPGEPCSHCGGTGEIPTSGKPLPSAFETIDITPVGCQTPEGNKRVTKAMREFDDATADVANAATIIVNRRRNGIPINGEDWAELYVAVDNRQRIQEGFLRAVAGVPER